MAVRCPTKNRGSASTRAARTLRQTKARRAPLRAIERQSPCAQAIRRVSQSQALDKFRHRFGIHNRRAQRPRLFGEPDGQCARILSRRFHHHAGLPDFRLPGQYLFEPHRKFFRAGAGSWKALHRQLADRHARLPVRNGQYGRIKKRFGHIDAHPVKWLGLLPRLRAPLIISWYTKRHRQYGFLDHPRLCGLRAQDSVRSLLETAGTGGGENLAVGLPRPREELASPPVPLSHAAARESSERLETERGYPHAHTHTQKKKKQKENTAETTGLLRVSS